MKIPVMLHNLYLTKNTFCDIIVIPQGGAIGFDWRLYSKCKHVVEGGNYFKISQKNI